MRSSTNASLYKIAHCKVSERFLPYSEDPNTGLVVIESVAVCAHGAADAARNQNNAAKRVRGAFE
jgi:hypothetical protein